MHAWLVHTSAAAGFDLAVALQRHRCFLFVFFPVPRRCNKRPHLAPGDWLKHRRGADNKHTHKKSVPQTSDEVNIYPHTIFP